MSEFYVLEEKDILDFRLFKPNEDREVSFYLHTNNAKWQYTAHYWRWLEFELKDGEFIVTFDADYPDGKLSKKEVEKMNKDFYELLSKMKNHPEYRLKILNLLNDEIRQIWNSI